MPTATDRLAEKITQHLEDADFIRVVDHDAVRRHISAMLPMSDAEIDEYLRSVTPDEPTIQPLRETPIKKLREALHADGLTLKCTLEAATAKVQEAIDEKRRRVYYQDIVYSVCNSLDWLNGGSVVCGTVDNPSTEVQEKVKELAVAIRASA